MASFVFSFFAMLAGARSDLLNLFEREVWLFMYAFLLFLSLLGFAWWRCWFGTHGKTTWRERPDVDLLFASNITILSFVAFVLLFEILVQRSAERLEVLCMHLICFVALLAASILTTSKFFLLYLGGRKTQL
jgi:hypothetical protein